MNHQAATTLICLLSCPAGGFQGLLHGAWFGPHWSRDGVPGRVVAVVLDEADALLGGGFAEPTGRVLEVCFW
jgi:hypothetical protein